MRARERLVVGCPGVPAVRAAAVDERSRMLHEGHAASLERACDEDLRPVPRGAAHRLERGGEGIVVVAVTHLDVPAEGAELRLQIAEREDLLGRLVRPE